MTSDFPGNRLAYLVLPLFLSVATSSAFAAPLDCAAGMPMSPPDAGEILFPVPSFKLSHSDANFPADTKSALNAPIEKAGALGSVSGLSIFRNVSVDDMAKLQGDAFSGAEGWKAAFPGNGMKSVGTGKFVGLYSDGKADVVVRVEETSTWPASGFAANDKDEKKLKELASRGPVVVYRYEGRGIVKAACAGELSGIVAAQ